MSLPTQGATALPFPSSLIRLLPFVLFLLGSAAAVSAGYMNWRSARSVSATEFDRRAYFYAAAVERSLAQSATLARYLAGVMKAAGAISQQDFRTLVDAGIAEPDRYLRAIWIAEVPQANVDHFIAERQGMAAPGDPPFEPFSLDIGTDPPAPGPLRPQQTHYLVAYSSSRPPLRDLLGYDWADYSAGLDLYHIARASGRLTTSGILPGAELLGEEGHIAVFVYCSDRPSPTLPGAVRAYASVTVPVEQTALDALSGFGISDLNILVSDGRQSIALRPMAAGDPRPAPTEAADGRFLQSVPVSLPGGQTWVLRFASTPATPGAPIVPSLLIGLLGVLAAAGLSLALQVFSRRHRLVRKDVEQRTAALVQANRALKDQSARLNALATQAERDRLAAVEANRAKTRFLASMSHELRTPLNAIIGFASVLSDQMLGPLGHDKYLEYAGDIQKSGQNLLGIVQDLLDIGKIEAGRLDVEKSWIDVGALFGEVERTMQAGRSLQGRTLSVEPCPDRLSLYADERLVRQALLNLLSNAMKFTGEGGHVGTQCRLLPDGGLELCVCDDGIGIAPKDLDRVLQPFVKSQDPYRRNSEGVGLGLALVKSFVEANGGRLALSSRYGHGTQARLIFPKEVVERQEGEDRVSV